MLKNKLQKTILLPDISLVPYSEKHCKELFTILDRDICENIGWPLPKNLTELKNFLHKKECIMWSIVQEKKVIGCIYLDIIKKDSNVWHKYTANIGYLLDKQYRNKGYVSQAVPPVLLFAFDTLKVARITAGCLETNLASKKVIEKNGFQLIGIERNYVKVKSLNRFVNHYFYDKIA